MKYTKPKWEATVIPVVPNAVVSFFHSLPAEFEIVEPGMTQVRWPRMLTRQCLLDQAVMIGNAGFNGTASDLHELAAIAPEEKKRRKVELWWHESWQPSMPPHAQLSGVSMFSDGVGGWRKVGECEVDA